MQQPMFVIGQASGAGAVDDLQNVHEFARRFRLSAQEEHRLIARYGVTASRIELLVNARRELSGRSAFMND